MECLEKTEDYPTASNFITIRSFVWGESGDYYFDGYYYLNYNQSGGREEEEDGTIAAVWKKGK